MAELNEEDLKILKERVKAEFSDYKEIAGGKNYRYKHLKTTHKMVKKINEEIEEETDSKILEIAALFHDIGRIHDIEDGVMDPFEGHAGHAERGAETVEDFIQDKVTHEELQKIKKIILNHHSEAETIEGMIVQDADKISNFGVSNLWRQIHYASQHELEIEESITYFWAEAIDDYQTRIDNMYFEFSKKVAENRLNHHKEAVSRIEDELNADDFSEV